MPAISSAYAICKHIGGRLMVFQVSNAIQKMQELQPKTVQAQSNAGDKTNTSNMFFQN